jgi:hypothetical protein
MKIAENVRFDRKKVKNARFFKKMLLFIFEVWALDPIPAQ